MRPLEVMLLRAWCLLLQTKLRYGPEAKARTLCEPACRSRCRTVEGQAWPLQNSCTPALHVSLRWHDGDEASLAEVEYDALAAAG